MIRSPDSDDYPEAGASSDPDWDLVEACRDPEDDRFEAAFEAIYDRYHDRVYSIAYRMLGSTTDSMDVVQEAFSTLFRKISLFRRESKFSTWLFRLVVNCCIDHKRRETQRRSTRVGVDHALETADPSESDPSSAAESSELGDHVHESLLRLSSKMRAVLVLRYLEGQTYEELAATLEISLGTVKSRLARAHLAFEKVLNGTLEPFDYPFGPTFERRRNPRSAGPGGGVKGSDGVEGVA